MIYVSEIVLILLLLTGFLIGIGVKIIYDNFIKDLAEVFKKKGGL